MSEQHVAKSVSGTLSATGRSSEIALLGGFNVTVSGTFVGTWTLDRSFDGGSSWHTLSKDLDGNLASFTNAQSFSIEESELKVLYSIDFTRTSGDLDYRLSQ